VKAAGPSLLPHSPEAGGQGWLPKLFDHTPSSDISQYNHFPISSARNFAIITMHDHGELFRLIYGVTEVTYQADVSHARLRPWGRALRRHQRRRRTAGAGADALESRRPRPADPVYQLVALRNET
jgi:hypothetical protein